MPEPARKTAEARAIATPRATVSPIAMPVRLRPGPRLLDVEGDVERLHHRGDGVLAAPEGENGTEQGARHCSTHDLLDRVADRLRLIGPHVVEEPRPATRCHRVADPAARR